MANYAYDSPTMNTAIDVFTSACDIVKGATESVNTAQNVLSSIASAGGDLGAEIGGTVLGNVRNASSSIQEVMSNAQKVRDAFNAAKQILEGIDNGIGGVFDTMTGVGDLINAIGGNTSTSTPNLGEYEGIVNIAGVIGELASKATKGDPITSTVLGHTRDVGQAVAEGALIQDDLLSSYSSRFRDGEIGVGEYFSGGLTAGTANAVVTIADGFLNTVGIDIPTSVNQTITDAAGQIGESAYRWTSTAVKSWMNWRTPSGLLGSIIT